MVIAPVSFVVGRRVELLLTKDYVPENRTVYYSEVNRQVSTHKKTAPHDEPTGKSRDCIGAPKSSYR